MARVIAWEVMSLDGFFEGDEPWDLRHHEHIWGEDLRKLSLQIGARASLLIFGRRTYEGMAAYWATDTAEPEVARYMNELPKLVASRTLSAAAWYNTEVTDDVVTELRHRAIDHDRPAYIFGSATLLDSLLAAGLIDELMIGIAPVVLGSGNPLFKSSKSRRGLRLVDAEVVDSGGVVLRYAPRNSAATR